MNFANFCALLVVNPAMIDVMRITNRTKISLERVSPELFKNIVEVPYTANIPIVEFILSYDDEAARENTFGKRLLFKVVQNEIKFEGYGTLLYL